MASTPDPPSDVSPSAVTILTTEHYNLQTARVATISEANGRASLFLGSVSAGLVALAFAGQSSRSALYTFGLVLFPVLSFLGVATFERALQASIADTRYMQRINRIRRFYVEAVPEVADHLEPPAATDDVEAVLPTEGFRPGRWQLLVSIVGAIAVINSVLVGVTVALAVAAATDGELWAAVPAGVAVFALALPLHERYQHTIRVTMTRPFPQNH
jgi:hypothetical protein